jgi:hypothetical protein
VAFGQMILGQGGGLAERLPLPATAGALAVFAVVLVVALMGIYLAAGALGAGRRREAASE